MQYLLSQLAELNIKIKAVDGKLHVNAPTGAMTTELASMLKEHKADLVHLLKESQTSARYEPLPKITPDDKNRYEPFPLTAIQHAYWMGRSQTKIELGGVSTHLYFESDAENLDIRRFEQAFNTLIKRHDALRLIINDAGLQQVLPEIPFYTVQVNQLENLVDNPQADAIDAIRNRMSHQVLPASKAPIMEVCASQLSSTLTRLHFSLDMLVLDAWSMMRLFKELHELYHNPYAALPKLDISYRDYVLTEERLVDTTNYEQAKAYWWDLIDRLPPAPQIPLRSDGGSNPPKFTRRRFRIPRERWQKLQSSAKQLGMTPTGIVLSAFTEVLTLWSASPHYSLNVTLFNRQPLHPQVDQLLGDFTSLMLLETDHRGTNTLRERMINTQTRFMRDLQHRAVSGLEVMRELRRRRSAMMEASMPVVFTGGLVYGDGDDAGLFESFGPMVYGISQTPQVSLDHQVMEVHGDLVCNWDCVEEKFAPGMLNDMYDAFCELMNRLIDDDTIWDQRCAVAAPEPQRLLRAQVNDTQADNPCHATLHGLFIQKALQQPQAPALISHHGLTISYGELLSMANALGQQLIESGVGPDQCVAVIMQKGWEQVVAVLGIHIAGGAYLPISSSFPAKRQQLLMEQGGASIAITQPQVRPELALQEEVEYIEVSLNRDLSTLTEAPTTRQQGHHLAYVLFTSGTTGTPKGIMIEHRHAVNTVHHMNEVFDVTDTDRVLAVSALNFDLSVYDIFGILYAGGALVFPSPDKLTDAAHWAELIDRDNVTLWNSAPALMGMLVDYLDSEEHKRHSGKSLRMVWLSGDRIPVPLPDRIRTCFKNARFVSLGGATEVSIWSIYYPVEAVDPSWTSIPYGKPLPNQTIHVLNENLQDCPQGVAGTIFIGGVGLARGYLNDEGKTNERFLIHPGTGSRLYNTGDLGRYLPDGNVEILGRADFQVKIRGYRIELGEIESHLTQHPEIKEAVAMPVTTHEGVQQIAAYVVPEANIRELKDSRPEQDCAFPTERLPEVISCLDKSEAPSATPAGVSAAMKEAHRTCTRCALSLANIGTAAGQRFSFDVFESSEVSPEFRHWCERGVELLASEGGIVLISSEGESPVYEVRRAWQYPDLTEAAKLMKVTLIDNGYRSREAEYLTTCVEEFAAVLKGEFVLHDVLYLGDSRRAYQEAFFAIPHRAVHQALLALVSIAERPVSILEVNAGVGAFSLRTAELLKDSSANYLITDPHEPHLEYLFEQLGGRYANVELGLLDVGEDFEAQGLHKHSFEVVLVSSASLAFEENPDRALGKLRSLLKPGGYLLMVESNARDETIQLALGLLAAKGTSGSHCQAWDYDWLAALRRHDFSIEQSLFSENSPSLTLFLAGAEAPSSVSVNRIKSYLAEHLPDYMVPQHIVPMDELPVSANGKVDYKALPPVDTKANTDVVEPRNDVEQHIHESWMTVIQARNVGIHDDFFDVGGDSLLAARVVREINGRLPDFKLEMFELFEHLTIEQLSILYASKASRSNSSLRKVEDVATSLKVDPGLIQADVKAAIGSLDEVDYQPRSFDVERPTSLLLTGATGWLGAYMLHELLRRTTANIYCLGRGDSAGHLQQRIKDNLSTYSLALTDDQLERIKPLISDMEEPKLGLSDADWELLVSRVEGIYHAAAAVGIAMTYADLSQPNLNSVVELARMSLEAGGAPIFFCSSAALLISHNDTGFSLHKPETRIYSPEGLIVGYAQSKWAAESVLYSLIDRGVPTKIFRIAHVLPDTSTHYAKPNYIFESVLAVARAANSIPKSDAGYFYGIPADTAGRLIIKASLMNDGYSGAVHVDNADPVDLHSLLTLMFEVQAPEHAPELPRINFEEWLDRCREARHGLSIEKQAILNFLLEPTEHGTMFEALYKSEPAQMAYLQSLGGTGESPLRNLTDVEYWNAYLRHYALE